MPKISDLPSGIPTTADVLPLVQGNTTKKATFNDLPIAAAASAALALKADAANPTFTGTVTGVSKTAVGLGNVDNTSDANKPISTATQTALNLKPSRNLLHNGNFVINQRLVSGTVTLAAGAYGHDRWKAGAGGCTYTFAASGNSFIITISAGSLMQVVEDKNVDGGVYTLSHQGTAQARVAINGAATSGAYAAVPLTTASATALQTMTVEFTTGTVDRVQLESGTLSTVFERRQYGLELSLCQRYARQRSMFLFGTAQSAGNFIAQYITQDVPMRIAPTLSIVGAPSYSNSASLIVDTVKSDGFRAYVTASAGGATAVDAVVLATADL